MRDFFFNYIYVGKVIGNNELRPHIGYQALGDVKTKSNQEQELMTPSTEAYICILHDNIEQKLHDLKKNGWENKVGKREKDGTNANLIDGKYTSQKTGSDPLHAFARVGCMKHKQIMAEIKEERAKNADEYYQKGKLILEEYRKLYKIVGNNKKEAKKVRDNKLSEEEAKIRDEDLEEGDLDW